MNKKCEAGNIIFFYLSVFAAYFQRAGVIFDEWFFLNYDATKNAERKRRANIARLF